MAACDGQKHEGPESNVHSHDAQELQSPAHMQVMRLTQAVVPT